MPGAFPIGDGLRHADAAGSSAPAGHRVGRGPPAAGRGRSEASNSPTVTTALVAGLLAGYAVALPVGAVATADGLYVAG